MKLLPSAKSLALRWTLLALVLACALEVFSWAGAVRAGQITGIVNVFFFLSLGLGLWLRIKVARLFALVILGLLAALVVVVGVFSAPDAMHYFGLSSRTAWFALMASCLAGSMFAMLVLSKYKSEFR